MVMWRSVAVAIVVVLGVLYVLVGPHWNLVRGG
jgi:hypothetical protein